MVEFLGLVYVLMNCCRIVTISLGLL